MASTSIRVEEETLARLRMLSKDEKRPIGQIVTDLVKKYEKEKFWKEMHEAFTRLREDPVAWKEYQDEAMLWQGGTADALKDEDPYYTAEEEAEINAEYARTYGR
jgi:predicted DNA-binding protein